MLLPTGPLQKQKHIDEGRFTLPAKEIIVIVRWNEHNNSKTTTSNHQQTQQQQQPHI